MGTLLLSAFLNFFRLTQEGFSNLYYAAAVKSMLTNWHNFFFVSFDAGGFVTVDKPPLGLWIQAASAALFGYHGISLLLPQALAGVLAVALVYHRVRRHFGPTAGLVAALVLAVTPISVAANRNNTMDSVLILLLLLAAWAVFKAAETGRLRWLLLCAVMVGLGFNVKMLQAFLVLPAFYLVYLVSPPLPWWKRMLHLALATAVLVAVSLSWAVLVDLTPPENRPYVGSSQDNTVMELIIGHNGMKRLLPGGLRGLTRTLNPPPVPQRPPRSVPPGGQPSHLRQMPSSGQSQSQSPAPSAGQAQQPGRAPPSSQPRQPPLQPGSTPASGKSGVRFESETGERGVLRLFNRQLAGQISWLLPLSMVSLVVAAWQTRLRFPLKPQHQALLLWGVWLLTHAVFFSMASMFHRYYLAMMGPAIAALIGIGMVAAWEEYRRPDRSWWPLPLALVGSALVEAYILAEFPEWSQWLTPLVIGLCLLAAFVLVIAKLVHRPRERPWISLVATLGVLALLIAPTVWALIPVWYGGDVGLPFAGPDVIAKTRRDELPYAERLVDYLLSERQGEEFLVATVNARTAAPIIMATGEPVMALGGFTGSDPILTVDELAEMVESGTVRFFLLSPQQGPNAEVMRWVVEHATPVPPEMWLPMPSRPGRPAGFLPQGGPQLFDCQGRLAAEGAAEAHEGGDVPG